MIKCPFPFCRMLAPRSKVVLASLTLKHREAIALGDKRKRRRLFIRVLSIVIAMSLSGIALKKYGSTVLSLFHSQLQIALVILAILLLTAILWLLPKLQCRALRNSAPEQLFDNENESRKTLAQIIGGLLVIGSYMLRKKHFGSPKKARCRIDTQRRSA